MAAAQGERFLIGGLAAWRLNDGCVWKDGSVRCSGLSSSARSGPSVRLSSTFKGFQLQRTEGRHSRRRTVRAHLHPTGTSTSLPGYEPHLQDAFGAPLHGIVQPQAARQKVPPIMPAVLGPSGPTDLVTAFFRNRIIFIGSPINGQVAQRVISQLMTLEAIDANEEIKMYINCPGGSTYSVLAIYDCMAWVKPDISTVAFGLAASQGALILAAGTKGKRFAMPNARIMIHQPQGGCGGTIEDVRRQVNEVVSSRDKLDKMFSAFTGQPLDRVQKFTDRDRFFSAAEAKEFGLIDDIISTDY